MYSPFFSFLHYVYCKTFHTIIPKVVGGGGYSGFQVTGMIEGFFGGRKILASMFLGSLNQVGIFWGIQNNLKICYSPCVSQLCSSTKKVKPKLFCDYLNM